ncbi:MAG: MipA/OmpV family protein [Candidatus Dechloromonas phosphoritropha]
MKHRSACGAGLALTVTLSLPVPVGAAEEKPLWEIGAGVSALTLPAYRGSDQTSNFILPVPFFSYHGDFFKADRHGIRGSFFDTDRVDFTVSLALSPPTGSEDIRARAGMPDLKATFEIGPQVDLTLWRSENRARFLKLRLPLRTALTVEGSPQDVGWVFSPNANFDITDLPGLPGWNLGLLAGPLFGSRRQNAYYYSVAPQYATPFRPAYEAPSGYAGMEYTMGVSKRFPNFWLGAFVRYGNLAGAKFEDSPLVLQNEALSAGVALSWIFGESSTRVMVDD